MTGKSLRPTLTEKRFANALATAGIATSADNVTAAYQTARWLDEGITALAREDADEPVRADETSP